MDDQPSGGEAHADDRAEVNVPVAAPPAEQCERDQVEDRTEISKFVIRSSANALAAGQVAKTLDSMRHASFRSVRPTVTRARERVPRSRFGMASPYPCLYRRAVIAVPDLSARRYVMTTHHDTPTEFIEVGDTRYAYRRFGKADGVPIVMLQHFTGGLDHWDPLLTDGLAADRTVILFDSAGIGASTGTTPTTIEGMADCLLEFVDALELGTFDLLGFSMGGMVAQAFAKAHSGRIRRLALLGTSPRGGEPTPYQEEVSRRASGSASAEDFLWLFFGHSDAGKAAGMAFLGRRFARTEDVDPATKLESIMSQVTAGRDWLQPHGERFADLKAITVPTLVVNGSLDVMLPTINSFHLQQHIPDAQLIVYPDAGHAAQFQYPELFLAHLRLFLDR